MGMVCANAQITQVFFFIERTIFIVENMTESGNRGNPGQSQDEPRSVVTELLEFKAYFVESLALGCGKWAEIVYDHTAVVMLAGLLFFGLSLIGLFPGIPVWIDGAENLYALPNTVAQNDAIIHNTVFQETLTHANFLILTTDPPGGNMLTWENIEKAQQIDNLVRGKVVDPTSGRRVALPAMEKYLPSRTSRGNILLNPDNDVYDDVVSSQDGMERRFEPEYYLTYEDMCAITPFGRCQVLSIFEMGIWDMKKLLPEDAPPELYILNGNIFNAEKKGFVPDYVLGGLEVEDCERELPTKLLLNLYKAEDLRPGNSIGKSFASIQCVKSVKALNFIYELQDKPEYYNRNFAWMDAFYDVMKANHSYNGILVSGNAFKSRDDELRKSTSESSDIIFVIFTFVFVISYTALINFSMDFYRNKCYVALCGSFSALMGIIAGFGISSLLGVGFVPTALVMPFLIIGVGTDDIFVLINSYSLAYADHHPRDRCIAAVRDCGVSIILTKTTSLIAFGVGVQSPYISIRNFCLFSLNGLGCSIFFEMTVFLGVLFAEARREFLKQTVPFNRKCTREMVNQQFEKSQFNGFINNLTSFDLVNATVEHQTKPNENLKPILIPEYFHKRYSEPKASLVSRFCKRGNYSYEPRDYAPVAVLSPRSLRLAVAKRHSAIYKEPLGNVGLSWREWFCTKYCPFILKPVSKLFILLAFVGIIGLAINGLVHMELGLELKDLSPDSSYLKSYDEVQADYFGQYDIPVYVFFPTSTAWWKPEVIASLRHLETVLRNRRSTVFFNNPLIRMVDDPDLNGALTSGDRRKFENTLYYELSKIGGRYRQFENDFVWEGTRLIAWKITLLPRGMQSSQERANWMKEIRQDCENIGNAAYLYNLSMSPQALRSINKRSYNHGLAYTDASTLAQPSFRGSFKKSIPINKIVGKYGAFQPINAIAWNYMMLFYESDLHLVGSVISSMTTAMISMFVAAILMIPDLSTGLIVLFVMTLIDMAVMGFMYYWNVKLQMITMICLVISIGFSIDYSAHICHTFTHCKGKTRNLRAVECVVLMGTPVFHGAVSTIVGIVVLGYSESFIFRLFFKMLMLTLLFGILHGLVLLPVVLSLIGVMPSLPPPTRKALPPGSGSDENDPRSSIRLISRNTDDRTGANQPSEGKQSEIIHIQEIAKWPEWDNAVPAKFQIHKNQIVSGSNTANDRAPGFSVTKGRMTSALQLPKIDINGEASFHTRPLSIMNTASPLHLQQPRNSTIADIFASERIKLAAAYHDRLSPGHLSYDQNSQLTNQISSLTDPRPQPRIARKTCEPSPRCTTPISPSFFETYTALKQGRETPHAGSTDPLLFYSAVRAQPTTKIKAATEIETFATAQEQAFVDNLTTAKIALSQVKPAERMKEPTTAINKAVMLRSATNVQKIGFASQPAAAI